MTTTVSHTTQERAQALLARAAFWPKAYDRYGVVIGYSFRSSRTMPDALAATSPAAGEREG